MSGQHSNATKEARSREAIAVAEEMRKSFLDAQAGRVMAVLFEEEADGFCVGHTPNYLKVYAKGKDLHNQIRAVRLTEPYADGMLGQIL
jgi:tRNA A37 methylthiotransferase MiaB